MLSQPGSFGSFTNSTGSPVQRIDDCLQPTFDYALRAWWAYYWPTSLISLAAILGARFVLSAVAGLLISLRTTRVLLVILPYAAGLLVSIFIIHYLLGKQFRDFRIALLPRAVSDPSRQLPVTFRRTIRVWWAFSWRTVVYSFIAEAVATIPLNVFIGTLSEMGRWPALLARMIAGAVIAGAVGMYVIYSNILNEEFGDFRVCLLSLEGAAPVGPPISPQDATPGS